MVHNSKPNPEIFLNIASLADVPPEKCLVIEDAEHGVTAALKAGMKVIGLQNHHSGNQDLSKANLVVDSLDKVTHEVIQAL